MGPWLFASVLYKITIQPVLVMRPGHMFIGYRVSPQGPWEFLETTMLGSGRPVALHTQPFPRHDLRYLQSTISYEDFVAAIKKGDEEYRSEVQPRLQQNDPGYRLIEIKKVREMGISPIPR